MLPPIIGHTSVKCEGLSAVQSLVQAEYRGRGKAMQGELQSLFFLLHPCLIHTTVKGVLEVEVVKESSEKFLR